MYGNGGVTAQIVHDTLPCIVKLQDAIGFAVELRDTDGNLLDTTAYDIRWCAPVLPDTVDASSVVLDQATVDSLIWVNSGTTSLRVIATDTATGAVFTDRIVLVINSSEVPDASYDATINGRVVTLSNYGSSGASRRADWQLGDGYRTDDALPAPYTYAQPATYTITHTLFWGNDDRALCTKTVKRLVTADTAAFAGICPDPDNISLDYATANRARLTWNAPFGATAYNVRYRKEIGPGTWRNAALPSREVAITKLEQATPYRFEVQAVCGADTSDWSHPSFFITAPCTPPRSIEIDRVNASGATVRWLPGQDPPIGEELIYKSALGGPFTFEWVPFDDSLQITGLDTNTLYYFKMRSVCPSNDGTLNNLGPLTQLLSFTTLDTTAALRLPAPEPAELQLRPNPASTLVELRFDGPARPETVEVRDAAGRIVLERAWTGPVGRFEVSGWSEGLYLVRITDADGRVSAARMVVAH